MIKFSKPLTTHEAIQVVHQVLVLEGAEARLLYVERALATGIISEEEASIINAGITPQSNKPMSFYTMGEPADEESLNRLEGFGEEEAASGVRNVNDTDVHELVWTVACRKTMPRQSWTTSNMTVPRDFIPGVDTGTDG